MAWDVRMARSCACCCMKSCNCAWKQQRMARLVRAGGGWRALVFGSLLVVRCGGNSATSGDANDAGAASSAAEVVDQTEGGGVGNDAADSGATSPAEVLERATAGETYEDCGCIGPGCSGDAGAVAEAVACFTDGAAECRPVLIAWQAPSTEGDPIVATYITASTSSGCEILVVDDATQDRFGNCTLSTRRCRSVSFSDVGDGSVSGLEGCTEPEIVSSGCMPGPTESGP